jgi:hypothetical protein
MRFISSNNDIPVEMATEEAWVLLRQRYTTHLLACGFQPSALCCGAGLAAPTLAGQCPTCQKPYGDGNQTGARGPQASERVKIHT